MRAKHPSLKPWLCILLFLCAMKTGWAATSDADVKAVFLFHFTQFVEWPQAAFPSADAPFVIGIVGANPIESVLAGIVRGETVGKHPIIVRELRNQHEASKCQLVYVSEQGERLLDARRLKNSPILTVGESDSFFRSGGTIQLYLDRRHVRLRINLAEARSHSLVISAKLLRVADVSGGPSALELPSGLAEDGPLDLLLLRAGHAVLDMGAVQEILANDR